MKEKLNREGWNTAKFLDGMVNLVDAKKWGHDLSSIFNIRKLLVYVFIIGMIFGYGYWRGQSGKPVNFNLSYDKAFSLQLDGQVLHKPKNSNQLQIRDNNGKIIKIISAKDIPELQKKLRPYGFQFQPYFSYGVAIKTDEFNQDVGVGVSWFRYFKFSIGNWISNNGIWFGLNYRLTNNCHVGTGVGKGYDANNLLGFRIKFDF